MGWYMNLVQAFLTPYDSLRLKDMIKNKVNT